MWFRAPILLLALAVSLVTAGCERPQGQGVTAEIDDPDYIRAKTLLRQNRNQEALAAFLQVIERRGEDASESHLDAGQIYHEQIKDPLAAIYHYRKYLELKPNGQKVELVRGRIHAATRDFARTLPAQPHENLGMRNDLLDVVEQLQRENAQLKTELAAARTSASVSMPQGTIATLPMEPRPTVSPAPVVSNAPRPMISTSPAAVAPTRPVIAAPAGRTHVVVQGQGLYAIARMYSDGKPLGARLDEIVAANRDLLPNGRDSTLAVGMVLRIP